MILAIAAVLSQVHLTGEVPTTGGDYLDVPFEVPANTKEIAIHHDDGSTSIILDWGVWSPSGFRGWGGGNTEDVVIGVDDSSRSYLPGPIEAGTWHLVIGKALLAGSGNAYVADITCSDTTTLTPRPRAAFAPTTLAAERRWYAGDFHVHSTESGDAQATFAEIHELATSRGLDFVNLSDHNTISQHALIAAIQPTFSDLLLLRGTEITTYAGHGNSLGVPSYVDHRIGYQGRAITGVLDDVAAAGGIFIVNHPKLELGDACIGCAWKHADTDWSKVAAIELITGNYDIGVTGFVPQVVDLWEGLLDDGHRIAIVGGSDDHDAGKSTGFTASPIGSPTTLVLADGLSEAAIIDAVRRGRTMVKLSGPDDPDLDVTLGDAEIGDDVDGIATATFAIHVARGTGGFAQLYRNGEKVATVAIASDDFTTTLSDTPGAGDFRYRVEIVDGGNARRVVTSHFYVHAVAAEDGCGCHSARAVDAAPFGIVVLGLRRRRRRSTI